MIISFELKGGQYYINNFQMFTEWYKRNKEKHQAIWHSLYCTLEGQTDLMSVAIVKMGVFVLYRVSQLSDHPCVFHFIKIHLQTSSRVNWHKSDILRWSVSSGRKQKRVVKGQKYTTFNHGYQLKACWCVTLRHVCLISWRNVMKLDGLFRF